MNLPRQQQKLYDLLFGKGDVPIVDMYCALRGEPGDRSVADQQRTLGPYIVALNRTLAVERLRVEPGALKQTYRLVIIDG